MTGFELVTELRPAGDQPQAIEALCAGLQAGRRRLTLLGATGTGKTYTMAAVIARLQRPALVLAPNKTLAAQLYSEFKEFFPRNAVEFFVSYYDYYQPEAYVPRSDTYIEKDSEINDEIQKRRFSTTRSLLERRDVLVVASVSCIYGLGSAEDYHAAALNLKVGEPRRRERLARALDELRYARQDAALERGTYRLRGAVLEVFPAYDDVVLQVELWGDRVEAISSVEPLTGRLLTEHEEVVIYPARHFVTARDKLERALVTIEEELRERCAALEARGKLVEAQRLRQRTEYDLMLLRETGACAGIENYARHLSGREPGAVPWTLLDYLPDDALIFVDESHVAIPQVRGMWRGDRARKETLIAYGFRLPSALDNRPLTFEEFERHLGQAVFVSATPGPYELEHGAPLVEQLIRPTGLLDPVVEVRPTAGQIDDLVGEVRARRERGERALVTTLTKATAEALAAYLAQVGLKVHHLHADVETLERLAILRDLRLGVYDVVVGINLLREGLDLPEVSLVAILDADQEGYLRSQTALIQTIGRAARHVDGRVIMYADATTEAMRGAIAETARRRALQAAYNAAHGVTPASIQKAVRPLDLRRADAGDGEDRAPLVRLIADLERQMKEAVRSQQFERAALARDEIHALRAMLSTTDLAETAAAAAATRPARGRRGRGGEGPSAPASADIGKR